MFRGMRREDKIKTREEAEAIMKACDYGILSVSGDDDYPYGVPVSYIYKDNKIFIHCAKEGHKMEAIKRNPKVSFAVVDAHNPIPEKFTATYSSAIAFGKARISDDRAEKQAVLEDFLDKFCVGYREGGLKYIDAKIDACMIIVIDIEQLTGKGLA